MEASVAIAIALASSSVATEKYSLYRSYNTLYTSAFLSRSLYSSDFIFHKAGSDLYSIYVNYLPQIFTVTFFFLFSHNYDDNHLSTAS